MTAASERDPKYAEDCDRIERLMLRLRASTAQKHGIDITHPGWGDELDDRLRMRAEEITT